MAPRIEIGVIGSPTPSRQSEMRAGNDFRDRDRQGVNLREVEPVGITVICMNKTGRSRSPNHHLQDGILNLLGFGLGDSST